MPAMMARTSGYLSIRKSRDVLLDNEGWLMLRFRLAQIDLLDSDVVNAHCQNAAAGDSA